MSGLSVEEEFLAQNPTARGGQDLQAFFAYLGANSDNSDRVRILGDNTFGFEDLALGRSDFDYNDVIFKVDLAV